MSGKAIKGPRVFVPLTKVDEENRLVHGVITQEILDKSGEAMDYETSKPHFEKWSADIEAASGGLSKGNVRVMHGLTVAGKLTELDFNDDDKSIEVCAKVVDDSEWNKVLEGCYTGFSVGGKYGKKWTETTDGVKLKKYEAIPNEVSLVDNPCVPSATFSLTKADGSEELVPFKVENDDEAWPAFSKADAEQEEQEVEKKVEPKPVEKTVQVSASKITNPMVAERATALAKAANDGSDWMSHIETARNELMKEAGEEKPSEVDPKDTPNSKPEGGTPADNSTPGSQDAGDDKSEKVTPSGVKQVWAASDGKTFEKKSDAVAHDATLVEGLSEVDKLKKRLEKAVAGEVEPEPASILSLDRIEDLHKAVLELELPRGEDAAPLLEKGMYTVSRFANMLGDVASLARTIKAEGKIEADSEDENISKTLTSQLGTFGESFMTYAKQQIAEMVAGLDTDLSPRAAYDYYYRAAGEGNDLAKNVVELIEAVEEDMEEAVEKLAKFHQEPVVSEELSPPLQKRFDEMKAENGELKKIAEDAIAQVETLTKRVETVENTPTPRPPKHVLLKTGVIGEDTLDANQKLEVLKGLVAEHGADGVATLLIKASQQSGGIKMGAGR